MKGLDNLGRVVMKSVVRIRVSPRMNYANFCGHLNVLLALSSGQNIKSAVSIAVVLASFLSPHSYGFYLFSLVIVAHFRHFC